MGNGHGTIIVYSITDDQSFQETSKLFEELVSAKEVSEPYNIPIVLVGNKVDLESDRRMVTKEEGEEQAKKFGESCRFFETSAKLRINVDRIFEELVRLINKDLEQQSDEEDRQPASIESPPSSSRPDEKVSKKPTKTKKPCSLL
ncbi:GTP-binding protein Rit [Acrasis kona]